MFPQRLLMKPRGYENLSQYGGLKMMGALIRSRPTF